MAARWLSPAEAARKLGVSESTIWRFLRREQLPSVKLGGRRRIPASAVGQLVRPLRPVKAEDIPPLTLESPLFSLAGRFRSTAAGPGASDPLSLCDAIAFAVMDRLRARTAFTFDRHFRQYGFDKIP